MILYVYKFNLFHECHDFSWIKKNGSGAEVVWCFFFLLSNISNITFICYRETSSNSSNYHKISKDWNITYWSFFTYWTQYFKGIHYIITKLTLILKCVPFFPIQFTDDVYDVKHEYRIPNRSSKQCRSIALLNRHYLYMYSIILIH